MKIIMLPLAFVFLLTLVSATITQTTHFKYATIDSNGNLITTNTPISGANAIMYQCTDSNCNFVIGGPVFTESTSTDSMVVTYPTTSALKRFGTYFYKEGYIDYEINTSASGSGVAPDLTVYLSRMQSCYSPITNLQVLNEVEPNKPLSINVTTNIDSDAHAEIQNAGPLNYNPPELTNYRKINTSITLTIKDSTGSMEHTETQYVLIDYSDYSGSQVHFEHTFNHKGKHTIEITSGVPDSKCILSIPQTESANVNVVNQSEVNYSYSLIQNLSLSPVSPLINQNVNFSFNYLSNYINLSSDLIPVNTTIYSNITRGGVLVSQDNFILPPYGTNFSFFSFVKSFTSPGTYVLTVRGVPNTTLSSNNLDMSQSVQFIVNEINNPSNDFNISLISPLSGQQVNVIQGQTTPLPLIFNITGNTSNIICNYTINGNRQAIFPCLPIINYSIPFSFLINGTNILNITATNGIFTKNISSIFYLSIVSNQSNQSNQTNCSTQWTCSAWSTCSNRVQTRVCIYQGLCAPLSPKPSESQSCGSDNNGENNHIGSTRFINSTYEEQPKVNHPIYEDEFLPVKQKQSFMPILLLMLIISLILLIVLIYLLMRR